MKAKFEGATIKVWFKKFRHLEKLLQRSRNCSGR